MSRYVQRFNGDVVVPERIGRKLWAHKIACCDCGLVHVLRFTVVLSGNRMAVAFSATRDNRATAARRRYTRKGGTRNGKK